MRAPRRALIGLLSVLLPAGGIAYLGAVSYQEDRGIVAARIDEQFRAAQAAAGSVEDEIAAALDVIDRGFAEAGPDGLSADELAAMGAAHPLAARPFAVDPHGGLIYPAAAPLRAPGGPDAADRLLARTARPCPQRGLVACVRALQAAEARQRELVEARRLERGGCPASDAPCRIDVRARADARRRYQALARHDDTAAAAILGLARIARDAGRAADARGRYGELAARFGREADDDGVPYRLLADVGGAEVAGDPASLVAVVARVLDRRYRAPPAILDVVVERLLARAADADPALDDATRGELAALAERFAHARAEARLHGALRGEVEDLPTSAGTKPRGRRARGSLDTIVYRRAGDRVIGAVIDRAALVRVAAAADVEVTELAEGARVMLIGVGDDSVDRGRMRTLASSGFGQTLPHLELELVNDRANPDPLDEIVRTRGRRHLAITGGLVAILLVGLFATIRGAARERELARLKSEFVATVSHELKTPLTSIRMFAEMLQQDVAGTDRERERNYQGIIVKESERLGLLIANLLDYSQIEKGIRRYVRQPERAGDVFGEAVETFGRLRENQAPAVETRVAPAAADASLLIDRSVIVQALLNLLSNAVKYGGAEAPVEATLERHDGQVVFTVRDRGPGIPKAEQARIFKEFYRAPAAYASQVEGTGLGLALVKRHVEAQQGSVQVESAVGKGARFTITLPAADA